MDICLSQYILYRYLAILIPPQNMFKMFPHKISILAKADVEFLQITIEAVLFSLYQRLFILTYHMNPLVNL